MIWIALAMVLWFALLAAHVVELRRVAQERSKRREIDQGHVDECLANIDHVIDLRAYVGAADQSPAAVRG